MAICAVALLSLGPGCSGPDKRSGDDDTAGATMPPGGGTGSEEGAGETAAAPEQDTGNARADQLIRERTLGEQERRRSAQFYLKQADKRFAEGDYPAAEVLYRRALSLDPGLERAKKNLARSQMALGKRDGEIRGILEEFGEEVKVLDQQRLIEARRLVDEGKSAYADGDVQRALDAFELARERLIWFEYGVDISDLRDEVQRLYDEARGRKLAMEDAARLAREEKALEEAERLTRESGKRREDRIERLMDRIQESMVHKEFDAAIDLCDTILDIDPSHVDARRLRDRAKNFLFAHRYTAYLDRDDEQTDRTWEQLSAASIPYEDPFRFPDDENYWKLEVARRSATLATTSLEESFEIQKIRRALSAVSPNFEFDDQPLRDVVAFLRTISDLNITIDPEIDSDETRVNVSLQNVRLGEALDLILKNTGLAYTFTENTLFITEPGKAHGDLIFEIYPVTDILNRIKDFPGPTIQVRSNDETDDGGASPFGFGMEEEDEEEILDPESLKELIIESTGGEDLWEESGSDIVAHKGQILVTATRDLHLALQSFLDNLRKDSDLFVIVEARFIDMVDDFLEDIGVDTRNLGQPPGQGFGTAFGILNTTNTGGSDPGFMNAGSTTNTALLMGQERIAGRIQHVLDGFIGAAQGSRLSAALRGLSLQVTWLDPFQLNAILRASQEERAARIVTAPRVTASNGQRVHVSVITQRAYVQDYELVSGGTGLIVQEVADPVVDTFQDGVVLDVRPVISSDRKYITLDVRPTLASLINGIISTVTISLGSLTQAATLVDIDLPEISLQQAFTSVTVPDRGTVLLGGFRSLNERKYESYVPIFGKIPIVKNVFRRKAYLNEKRSLYILLTARIIDLRSEEKRLFN
ncbi:MAG: secretin and TonB N-terminal domain-containing protein [Planctomycetota bacterium]